MSKLNQHDFILLYLYCIIEATFNHKSLNKLCSIYRETLPLEKLINDSSQATVQIKYCNTQIYMAFSLLGC